MIEVADLAKQECEKYEKVWAAPEYDRYSPGLENVDRFMKVMKPDPLSTIIDIGCGAGRAGLEFEKRGLIPYWLDITDAALDPAVPRTSFTQAPIWSHEWGTKYPHGFDYGFCCDVLEHILPELVLVCIDRIMWKCRTAWLQIAHVPDEFGPKLIGEPLHLCVRPHEWWLDNISLLYKVVDARELSGCGLYVVER